ncbi:MAG: MG2 domain-containing protein [Saprospiraceae bacterium]|nr:MG2 domain-containing protein [Saprospiraceae bacterium]
MRNLLLLILLLCFSCKSKDNNIITEPSSQSEDFGKYITEYSKRTISVKEDLIFRLSGAVIDADKVGEKINSNIFAISPTAEGEAYWKDMSTIVFSPKKPLQYNTNYTVTLQLGSLFDDVPTNLQKVNFPFFTRPMTFEMDINDIVYDPNKGSLLSLSGNIESNDYVDEKMVESLLVVKQKGNKNLQINWTHSNGGFFHRYEVTGIERKDTPSELNLLWNDNSFNSGFKGDRTIVIYPEGEFEVVSAEVAKGNNRKISLSLTDPVNKSQDLNGLIKIKDYNGGFKYDITGSVIHVYPQNKVVSPFSIIVNKSILNTSGKKLKKAYSSELSFDPIKPAIRLAGKGVIVPHNKEIIFPFEAINLKGAKIEILKIFSDNVLQFLQYNRLNTTYSLEPVGRIIHQEDIKLTDINTDKNDANYVRYALDLSKMISPDPGAIYQVRIGFDQKDIGTYECSESTPEATLISQRDGFTSIMNRPANYNWSDRDNPCKSSYYNSSRFITRNMLGSNIGIIAKRNKENKIHLVVSDLRTIAPLSGANVSFYDFQKQEMITSASDTEGKLTVELEKSPSFAIVTHNGDFGYINLQDHHANSLSEFEVSGRSKSKGIDGYIYGERGVWRPGDTIYLNFVLEDKENRLPSNHPVSMVVKDAKGKEKYNVTTTSHAGHIYNFPVATNDSDPTGNWTALVKVGGTNFQKSLKVETVKPNRLKIEYDIDPSQSIALHQNQSIKLQSKWLHGAPANGLKAKVDLQIQSTSTRFKGFNTYVFDDPARKVEPLPITVYDSNLNSEGHATINLKQKKQWLAPGKLRANFKTKVFEKGGNFSEDNFSMNADLYSSYVGLNIPKTRWGSKFIKQDTPTDIPIVVLDTDGKPIPNRNLTIGIYKAEWNWWYDRGYSRKYNFNSSLHKGALSKTTIQTNSMGQAMHNVEFEGYGNYMIRVCDEVSGHCTGDMFYTGYSWSRNKEQNGPQQLIFSTDKKSYTTGDNITLKVPSNAGSKLLVSIENGKDVLKTFWVDGEKDETSITIPAESSMNSNVYLHVHLIQPHNNGDNDLPMRMYGIVPITVIDGASQIEPELSLPKEIRPNQSFTVKVSEKLGRPMSYTLAVVDEGLLDLTRFKTPDLWNHFYSKQALGIKTWDIYDMVLDGYGGAIDRLISIGGDLGASGSKKGKKANRFVPVVKHLGPFTMSSGEEHSHVIQMPNYVGSVRTMIVARHNDAYGKAEEATPVKKPLMVLATLPRVLGPNETLKLPANIFAMEDKVKDVKVSVETSDNLSLINGTTQNIYFDKIGDKQAYFDMSVGNEMGPANVKIRAQGNGEGAFDEVNINIRNPNPYTSKVYEATIQPGQEWAMDYIPFGTNGSNEGVLELSTIPPMNFSRRLKYLVRYPYGCIEQTTSSVFPQLYLDKVTELDEKTKYKIEKNINRAIQRLALFQTNSGGFSYWPGGSRPNEWGSNYGLHFLLEAKEKGYFVSQSLLNKLLKYQDSQAESVSLPSTFKNKHQWRVNTQAYRLYTLAKAGRANIGAMNILRNYKHLSLSGAHMLAASYALIGKKEIAKQLVANKELTIKPYIETGYTYGSHVRDMAMMAEAQLIIGNVNENAQLIKQIAKEMSSQQWYGTQTTSYALLSLGKFLSQYKSDEFKFQYAINGAATESGISTAPTVQKTVDVENSSEKNVKVKNTSEAVMFVRYVLSGQLPPGVEEPAESKHINMKVTYTDIKGAPIDHTRINQGTDFVVKVTIQNLGTRANNIQEMALSQIFPSGWEIQNERLSSMSNVTQNSRYDYRDIRDDRVYTFFDINGINTMTYSILLNATYAGRFYLPPVFAEAMYDNEIQAKTKGQWVEVVTNKSEASE